MMWGSLFCVFTESLPSPLVGGIRWEMGYRADPDVPGVQVHCFPYSHVQDQGAICGLSTPGSRLLLAKQATRAVETKSLQSLVQ